MERRNSDGSTYEVVNGEHIQRSRVRIDARKWKASKLAPKKYGEKIQHAGHDGGALTVRWEGG
jgi:membrane protein implicated in regulation of membrane protease activity